MVKVKETTYKKADSLEGNLSLLYAKSSKDIVLPFVLSLLQA